jgi:hypothetical protein
MPQFDFFSYATQVFWFLGSFCLFYSSFLFFFIVRYAEVLKLRNKLVDLRKGKQIKNRKRVYDTLIQQFFNS